MVRKLANPDVQSIPLEGASNPPLSTIPAPSALPSASELPSFRSQEPVTLQPGPKPPSETTYNVDKSGSTSDSDGIDTGSDWDNSDDEEGTEPCRGDVPAVLKVGAHQRSPAKLCEKDAFPATLRVGPLDGVTRWSQDSQRSEEPRSTWSEAATDGAAQRSRRPLRSQNPYLRLQKTGHESYGDERTIAIWDGPAPLQVAATVPPPCPAELPSEKTPVDELTHQSLDDGAREDEKPVGRTGNGASKVLEPPLLAVTGTNNTTASNLTSGSGASRAWVPGMTSSTGDGSAPDAGALTNPREAGKSDSALGTSVDQVVWEKEQKDRRDREVTWARDRATSREQGREAREEWHRTEADLPTLEGRPALAAQHNAAPALPPRRSLEVREQAPPKPPRPQAGVAQELLGSRSKEEIPQTASRRQRIESYQIKSVNWYDHSSKTNPRRSPILIQNANGPCPLLSLVNALVLTTPSDIDTALVESLRTREQISLGLLLDAVFDELTSGRRGGSARELPDVSELYAFLLALHTGMNVNPRFVPSTATLNLGDGDNRPTSSERPAHRSRVAPGEFEQTREMRLYSTFNVPLVHGWLPPSDTPTYQALQRSAPTFEDAQNVQFSEEELEVKLRTQGLSSSEQQLFEDIILIKQFLSLWPTQLTQYGLQVLGESLEPGEVAILFRNDHFSTLYKQPDSHLLMSLVTDAGYSTHDEIVWESLVDVSGQGSELFTGDFRSVSGHPVPEPLAPEARSSGQPVRSLLHADDRLERTAVESRKRDGSWKPGHAQTMVLDGVQETGVTNGTFDMPSIVPQPQLGSVLKVPSTTRLSEQEDHDLALALQLQEEEEDRHRRETEARRRENDLSLQFLSQDYRSQSGRPSGIPQEIRDRQARPTVPPRRNNIGQIVVGREEPAPPPSYEQAASGPQFHPPRGHPASPHAPVHNASSLSLLMNRQQRGYNQQSAYYATASAAQSRPMLQPSQSRRASGRRSSLNVSQMHGTTPDSSIVAGSASIGPGGANVNSDREEKCVVM